MHEKSIYFEHIQQKKRNNVGKSVFHSINPKGLNKTYQPRPSINIAVCQELINHWWSIGLTLWAHINNHLSYLLFSTKTINHHHKFCKFAKKYSIMGHPWYLLISSATWISPSPFALPSSAFSNWYHLDQG